MKKRRSTVYVRPGKDITLYVPTDTPPEVIDFLNGLKKEGGFSQGVIDIVTQYVRRQRLGQGAAGVPFELEADRQPGLDSPFAEVSAVAEYGDYADSSPESAVIEDEPAPMPAPAPEPLSLEQIFRQARMNSGKLSGSPDG